MGKIKEFYHEEISKGMMRNQFIEEEQKLEEWAENNMEYIISVKAPDKKKISDMIDLAKRQIINDSGETNNKFTLPGGFKMSYSIKKIK